MPQLKQVDRRSAVINNCLTVLPMISAFISLDPSLFSSSSDNSGTSSSSSSSFSSSPSLSALGKHTEERLKGALKQRGEKENLKHVTDLLYVKFITLNRNLQNLIFH